MFAWLSSDLHPGRFSENKKTVKIPQHFPLKGTVSRDFLLLVFFMIQFPPSFRVFHLDRTNFFENSRRYSRVKVHHRYQRHRWQIFHRCQRHRRRNCRRYQPHRWQLMATISGCHQFPLCCWHRWQIIGTISGCIHLKVNLKAKIYIYVNSTTQRCQNKIIKIFLLEGFFHLPPVSLTPVPNLELWISPRMFEKIRNGPNGIIRGLGETGSIKNPEAKNLVTLSL